LSTKASATTQPLVATTEWEWYGANTVVFEALCEQSIGLKKDIQYETAKLTILKECTPW